MRDYGELTRRLEREAGEQLPMGFAEVEQLIRSDLPDSARKHQAWWANTGTHSHAAAWMRPGWRTSRLDLSGERVTFVRAAASPASAGVAEKAVRWSGPRNAKANSLQDFPPGLVIGAERMLDAIRGEKELSLDEAVALVLNQASYEYWRKCWDAFDALGPDAPEMSSVDIIRGVRDA